MTATEVGGSVCVSCTLVSRRMPRMPPFLLMSSTARLTASRHMAPTLAPPPVISATMGSLTTPCAPADAATATPRARASRAFAAIVTPVLVDPRCDMRWLLVLRVGPKIPSAPKTAIVSPTRRRPRRRHTMQVVDAIAEILKREGVEYLSTYPTTPVIDAAATAGIRPVLCRQERVGVGIADGYSRTTNGRRIGVFAMQYGPGAENAFPGVATAYSDSVPVLVLPLGHQRDRAQIFPLFSSARTYASVTKWVETLNQAEQVSEVMRRAFNLLKMGRPGPVMVEIPADVAVAEAGDAAQSYKPVKATSPSGNPRDVAAAARALVQARRPGCALRRGLCRAARAGGATAGARDDDAGGKERLPGRPPAVARHWRRRSDVRALLPFPASGRCGLRRRMQLHTPRHGHQHSRGQDHHSRHQ